MLVVATDDGTVSILDESTDGPGGAGLKERRKFRVGVMCPGRSMKISDEDGNGSRTVQLGTPKLSHNRVSLPVAVVSVNGAMLAMKDSDNCFSTWDITTGLLIRRFVGHDDSSCMSHDKFSCKCMPWLHAWPESECPAVGHRSEITAMAISHIGDRIASADAAGVIFLWDTGTAGVIYELYLKHAEPMSIAFASDGKNFVVTDSWGFCYQYLTANGMEVWSPFRPSQCAWSRCQMRAVAWAPSSKNYIVGYERGQVKWAVDEDCKTLPMSYFDDTQALDGSLHLKRSKDAVNALAISPDGMSVAVAGERIVGEIGNGRICGFVSVYNSPEHTLRWKDFATPGHDGGITSLSFSLDGKQLASAGLDKFVRIWDPRDGTRLKAFQMLTSATPSWPNNPILTAMRTISVTFYTDLEETPERHERRLAFAQGHQNRLGALSILATLSPDLIRTIGIMV
jgi:WD40 repeat protein